MIIEKFPQTAFQQNTRIVACEATGKAMCVDPGEASDDVVSFLNSRKLELQAIALTHGHLDHVGGVLTLSREFPDAEILLHKDDEDLYYGLPQQPLFMGLQQEQLAAMGMLYDPPPALTRNWEHGEDYALGEHTFNVRHCPGHTRGHVVLAEMNTKDVLVGDCLFWGSIGRTDLPGGDGEQLLDSIDKQIMSLDDDFTVHSGHGPETTVGRERRQNPFLTGQYNLSRGRYL